MPSRKLISFDWALKKLLRSKVNFGILEGFLSELLKEDISIIEILESESNQEERFDKYNRIDLKVRNSRDEIIIIEVQYEREFDYLQRILYGSSKVITEHLYAGEPYARVVKVISVNILYFDLGHGDDYIYRGTTSFSGIHTGNVLDLSHQQQELYRKGKISDLFPEYYLLKINQFDDVAKTTLDEWIYFLKNEEIKDEFQAKGLEQAKTQLDIMKLPKDERSAFERYAEDLHYQASMVESSYGVGKLEGRKEGKLEGRKEGRKEGREKAKVEIAINLLDILDDAAISKKAGLPVKDVQELRKKHGAEID